VSDFFAHATACVDEPATIGDGTEVWHFCHVMSGARVGRRCVFGQNVFVAAGAVVGDRVRVQNNVSIYDGVKIEDDVFIGPSAVLTNVSNPRAEISRKGQFETTRIRRGATLGANATVVCGVTIGRHAFIAAGAVVTRDVRDYALILGVPGRQAGWMGRHGEVLTLVQTSGGDGEPRGDERDYRCPVSGYRYREQGGELRCLDLEEDAPLPGSGRS
jgi:UDP-2-acetamido-3-amino-2,3-dideoxy-glucuronate N-acetyltransferase